MNLFDRKWQAILWLCVWSANLSSAVAVQAQTAPSTPTQQVAPAAVSAAPGQVVVTGTVPDEATKLAFLSRLRELYGSERVVDQISVGAVVMPAGWSGDVQKLLSPTLKNIRRGQLKVDGAVVSVSGEVGNASEKEDMATDMASKLRTGSTSYTLQNDLRVTEIRLQAEIEEILSTHVIEFEEGQFQLAPQGQQTLDRILTLLREHRFTQPRLGIIGHTDDKGLRASNVALSQARAQAVKRYFNEKGLDVTRITTLGMGPDRPMASNTTGEGRARNRRIEFSTSQ
jgi:OmpA-OmpF porin, OOP family